MGARKKCWTIHKRLFIKSYLNKAYFLSFFQVVFLFSHHNEKTLIILFLTRLRVSSRRAAKSVLHAGDKTASGGSASEEIRIKVFNVFLDYSVHIRGFLPWAPHSLGGPAESS
jgi:hypothetical protein